VNTDKISDVLGYMVKFKSEISNEIATSLYYTYYQIVHEIHKRVIKLLKAAKCWPNERDVKPFRTKINSSTALATATTRGSDLQRNSRERDCGDTTKKIRCANPNLLLQNKALDPVGDATWPTVMP